MKKFFKLFFIAAIGVVLLATLVYTSFHLWEYATSKRFVTYLSENSETIPLDENFTYTSLGSDVENNQLILVAEVHGFKEPAKFDVDFFKYLHKNHGVRHYIAEMDFVQAGILNGFYRNRRQSRSIKSIK